MQGGLLDRSHAILMVLTPPLVEASGGQEQYYLRSPWHLVSLWVRLTFSQTYPQQKHLVAKSSTMSGLLDIWWVFGSGWLIVRCQLDIWWAFWSGWHSVRHTPTSIGIRWPRVTLHNINLTFGQHWGQVDLFICRVHLVPATRIIADSTMSEILKLLQLKHSVFHHCHHFAIDHLHKYVQFTIYCLTVVKSTSAVLWSSANFCNIFQNMHSKALAASQYWKTNKVVWTWKDDWPPLRTSTHERPFTRRVTI